MLTNTQVNCPRSNLASLLGFSCLCTLVSMRFAILFGLAMAALVFSSRSVRNNVDDYEPRDEDLIFQMETGGPSHLIQLATTALQPRRRRHPHEPRSGCSDALMTVWTNLPFESRH